MAELHQTDLIQIPYKKGVMDIDVLERILDKNRISFLYTMPSFQNPTGLSTSQTCRERLLELCEKYRTPIVEDGFVEEMKYRGKSILPGKSMDQKDLVIYIGTFSKILFPGLRIGWIAADSGLIGKLTALRRITDLSGNSLMQSTIARFIENGLMEKYIRKIHTRYRERIHTAMKASKEKLDIPGISFTKPAGGYTFWIEWQNPSCTEKELISKLLDKNVAVSPGGRFSSEQPKNLRFRISIARSLPEEISRGIGIIGNTINNWEGMRK